ncbi:LAMI_0E06612g1_1 [Lachancea mirantina]|uniref:LAMI_0E06612g1_1 n=1 Tax=Lachancea mirantina TaxID=1230905 RepID=A0A1G4JLY0_9SACH|nr:LAMI_0E06612g1_1 [Lachancea mirantina]
MVHGCDKVVSGCFAACLPCTQLAANMHQYCIPAAQSCRRNGSSRCSGAWNAKFAHSKRQSTRPTCAICAIWQIEQCRRHACLSSACMRLCQNGNAYAVSGKKTHFFVRNRACKRNAGIHGAKKKMAGRGRDSRFRTVLGRNVGYVVAWLACIAACLLAPACQEICSLSYLEFARYLFRGFNLFLYHILSNLLVPRLHSSSNLQLRIPLPTLVTPSLKALDLSHSL